MSTIALSELQKLITRKLTANNTSAANAISVARALVAADADALFSHGCARTPAYAAQSLSGKVDGQATPRLHQIAPAALLVDAAGGFAFPAFDIGIAAVKELAQKTGIAALSVRHSHHSGAIGQQLEPLARDGLIALAFSNAPSAIAPAGGKIPLFGTNPIAFACPRDQGDPLLVDLSLSKVARGKVKLAADRGESIPDDWAIDIDGNPTTDAKAALEGSMTPIGESKGAALALMIEILCAGLSDSNFGFEAGSFFTGDGAAPKVAQLFLVIDPSHFASGFSERVERILKLIEEQPGTRIPGQRRYALRQKAEAEGVNINEELLAELRL